MITDLGNLQMLKQTAGQASRFADNIAVGSGSTVLPTTAKHMGLASGIFPITDVFPDFALKRVVFRAVVPANFAGIINEVGLTVSPLDGTVQQVAVPQNKLYTFSSLESWASTAPYTITADGNVGPTNYTLTNVANTDSIAIASDTAYARSVYSSIKIAMQTSNISSVQVRLENDTANYATATINVSNGYGVYTANIASLTTVGTFVPANVTNTRLLFTNSNATNSVKLDAMLLELAQGIGLVAHSVLSTPVTKLAGAPMDIERVVQLNG